MSPKTRVGDLRDQSWLVLAYKVPSEPSRARVGVWRELKRMGGLYVQQAVCVFPDREELRSALTGVEERIASLGGTSWFFEATMPGAGGEQLAEQFRQLTAREFAEIVEECEIKFVKEIEFERFRENYTFEEADEIRHDLEKIRRWYDRVLERDWFDSPGREEVERWLDSCEVLLEAFEDDVYERTGGQDPR